MTRTTRHIACALLILLVAATPAAADVTVEGTGEPAYTSSANNTQWIRWTPGTSRIRVDYYVNNVAVHQETYTPSAGGGTMWVNWSGIPGVTLPLQEGSQYGICVQGYWTDGSLHFPDFSNSCGDATQRGLRAYTTIDRTKPVLTVATEDGNNTAREALLSFRIGYQDATSKPFPATFTCVRTAADAESACGPSTGQLAYDAACSVPAQPNAKQTHFDCAHSLPAGTPDGPVTFCAGGADSSLPARPHSSIQTASAAEANISERACTTVLLDRAAPQLSVDSAGTAVAGQTLAFTAAASDATSGLTGQLEWQWGDGTTATGAAASHAYAAPGSYTVTATARDRAGNVATKTLPVTVEAPAQPPVQQPDPPARQPQPAPPAGRAGPVTAPELRLTAPKRLALKRGAKLPVALTTNGAGTATVALVGSGRVHVRRAVAIDGAGTQALRLAVPRRLRPGRYRLEVSYQAAGGAATASARVALSKSCRPRRCTRS